MLASFRATKEVTSTTQEPALSGWPKAIIPNFSEWWPGDIILVHADSSPVAKGVKAYQNKSLNPYIQKGQVWTHAAVYLGSGEIVDLTFAGGVHRAPIWEYCRNRAIRVRRHLPPWGRADGLMTAVGACSAIGQDYSLKEVARTFLSADTAPVKGKNYCSTFVGITISSNTSFNLHDKPEHRPLTPGMLAEHPYLRDVRVEWRHMASPLVVV